MKVPPPPGRRRFREDRYLGAAPPPRPVPLALELSTDDGALVRGLKRAWLPEGAWYLIACAFAKQLEARLRSDHVRALNEDVARFRLALPDPEFAARSRAVPRAGSEPAVE